MKPALTRTQKRQRLLLGLSNEGYGDAAEAITEKSEPNPKRLTLGDVGRYTKTHDHLGSEL